MMPHMLKCPRCKWSSRSKDAAHAFDLITDHKKKCSCYSTSSYV
jgi:hypothetical protein